MQEWLIGDGHAWGMLVRGSFCILFLGVLITGLIGLLKGMRHEGAKFRLIVLISLLWIPSMFSTCSAINWKGPDEAHDVFGFERPGYEEKTGFETRSMRRERGAINIFRFFFSAHGLVSFLTAIIVGIPFLKCLAKVMERWTDDERNKAYWMVSGCLSLVFLVIWSSS